MNLGEIVQRWSGRLDRAAKVLVRQGPHVPLQMAFQLANLGLAAMELAVHAEEHELRLPEQLIALFRAEMAKLQSVAGEDPKPGEPPPVKLIIP